MAEGKIRIKDIAKIAGVSATTVSNVIHGRTEKVSRKTRKRIEEILDEQEHAAGMGQEAFLGRTATEKWREHMRENPYKRLPPIERKPVLLS